MFESSIVRDVRRDIGINYFNIPHGQNIISILFSNVILPLEKKKTLRVVIFNFFLCFLI